MKILSVPKDHCGSHNNFMNIFSKNYTLYGVYIFINFSIRLNRFAFNSQAPDVPELAHRGIFRLSRLSVNSYHKTAKKYYPLFCPADPMKIIVFL